MSRRKNRSQLKMEKTMLDENKVNEEQIHANVTDQEDGQKGAEEENHTSGAEETQGPNADSSEPNEEAQQELRVQAPTSESTAPQGMTEASPLLPVEDPTSDEVVETSAAIERIDAALAEYSERMAANRAITVEEGVRLQRSLMSTYSAVFSLSNKEFATGMNVLLKYFRENKTGAFSDTHIFRFAQHFITSARVENYFTLLTRFFIDIANPASREIVLKHISLKRIFEVIGDEMKAQRLANYLNK